MSFDVSERSGEGRTTDEHQNDEPALRESFKLWHVVGVMASSQGTPLVVGGFLSLIADVGGSPCYVWGFFLSGIFSIMVMLSLAEISSAYPTPAGQIHWSGEISRNGQSRLSSYACGWICCFGWFLWLGGTTVLVADYICGLVNIYNPALKIQTWQVYLINVAIVLLCLLLNAPLFKLFSKTANAITYLFNVGAIFVAICLLARASPKQSARAVFVELTNVTGWKSDGLVFFIAASQMTATLSAFDTATHLADEVPRPSRTIPLVMVGSTIINFGTGFAMVVIQMFCAVDLNEALSASSGPPLLYLLNLALRNDALVTISCLIFIIAGCCSATSVLLIASRTWWSFARLNGMPFQKWVGKLDSRTSLPMNCLLLLTVTTIAITAISMGSETALNALLGGGGVCVFISYGFPIAQLVVAGRDFLPADRYFNLGYAGYIVNYLSLLWIPFISIMQFFPLYLPATPATMNYASLIIGAVLIASVSYWFFAGHKTYTIPEWKLDGVPCEATSGSIAHNTGELVSSGDDAYLKKVGAVDVTSTQENGEY